MFPRRPGGTDRKNVPPAEMFPRRPGDFSVLQKCLHGSPMGNVSPSAPESDRTQCSAGGPVPDGGTFLCFPGGPMTLTAANDAVALLKASASLEVLFPRGPDRPPIVSPSAIGSGRGADHPKCFPAGPPPVPRGNICRAGPAPFSAPKMFPGGPDGARRRAPGPTFPRPSGRRWNISALGNRPRKTGR